MHMRRMHISMDIMAAAFFMVLSPFLGDGGIIAHLPPPVNLFGRITIVFSLYCEIVRLTAFPQEHPHFSAMLRAAFFPYAHKRIFFTKGLDIRAFI